MKQIKYFENCESEYISFFPHDKLNELQNKWSRLKNNYQTELSGFPNCVVEIITADFEDLMQWYFSYQKLPDNIKGELKFRKAKKGPYEYKIFNYDDMYPYISAFFCNNVEKMNLYSCYYCDIHPIGVYTKDKGKRLTVDIDHFFPKADCPLLSLSLKNFVPSCQICNSRIKSKTGLLKFYSIKSLSDKNILRQIAPTSKICDYENNIMFEVWPQNGAADKINYLDNINAYRVRLNSTTEYKHGIDAFRLQERYNSIPILATALSILDLKRKFPTSKISEFKKLLNSSGKYSFTDEQIEEMIFRKDYDIKRHATLTKMKSDLLD